MHAVTIKEAKAHLNELVDAAVRGEPVVLMKGSKHVAAIVPLNVEELELPSRLTDPQAERFWRQIREEQDRDGMVELDTADEAVAYLNKPPHRRAKRRTSAR